jgi:hypothetical protein
MEERTLFAAILCALFKQMLKKALIILEGMGYD